MDQIIYKNPFLWAAILIFVLALAELSGFHSLIKRMAKETEVEEDEVEDFSEFTGWVKVLEVIDGDTMKVAQNGKETLIRLIGVDTPETVHPYKPVECFGRKASEMAKRVLEGKKVKLEADETQGNRDKYDRYLRYVFLEDGNSFNQMMIREGFAYEYTYEHDYRYKTKFQAAQLFAEINELGMWAEGICAV